ncbi:MAG TPA: Ig-like domain-containing protein [Candidatus Acidoferrum sp.]|nr:Ig-like domain-containing protein [Candidatus Acidoferrum sp.]
MKTNHLSRLIGILGIILLGSLGLNPAALAQTVSPVNQTIAPGAGLQFFGLNNNSQMLPMQQTRMVVSGYYHSCALLLNGTVKCWGYNYYGQLGNGTTASSDTPVIVTGLSNVTALAAGGYHTCALLLNGQMKCWGYNYYGQLGNGNTNSSTVPTFVKDLGGSAVNITAGYLHTCAVLSGGSVQCWGSNGYGQLGFSNPSTNYASLPTQIPGLSFVSSIAAGLYHTCVLEVTATIYCWGDNAQGQLGNNTTTNSSSPVQALIGNPKALVAGGNHTCALLDSDGEVMCWGDLVNSITPNYINGLTGAKSIAAGRYQACAVFYSGTAQCWGYNYDGLLGNGNTVSSLSTPVNVSNLSFATSVSAGGLHTCATIADGTVQCWGYNGLGELGDNTTATSYTPTSVLGDFIPDAGVRKIVSGQLHSCALLGDGTAVCWGSNPDGQLGNGTNYATYNAAPTPVADLTHIIDLAAGQNHTCALMADGSVACWGHDTYSSLPGCGQYNPCMLQPLGVGNVTQAIAISAGGNHTCALIYDGTVDCWGQNESFQNCAPANVNQVGCGIPVANVSQLSAISAGYNHTCGLYANGYVTCWGNNIEYDLGVSSDPYEAPVTVPNLAFVNSISAGDMFSCATQFTGTVQCWGYNENGQLGLGYTSYSVIGPTPVPNLSGVTSVAAGWISACAVTANGNLYCWGDNTYGELANNSTVSSSSPTYVPTLYGVTSVALGNESGLALLADGRVEAWGDNSLAELGNGNWNSSLVPLPTLPLGKAANWTSSSPGVASIDPVSGLATGLAAGTTTITVTLGVPGTKGSQSASTTLTVN